MKKNGDYCQKCERKEYICTVLQVEWQVFGQMLARAWRDCGRGELEFVMGPELSDWAVSGELPPSMSDDR